MCKEKKWKRESEKNGQKSTGRDNKMLLDTDRSRNIDILDKKKCLFSVGHTLLSDTEFKGEGPTPSGYRPPLVRKTPVNA